MPIPIVAVVAMVAMTGPGLPGRAPRPQGIGQASNATEAGLPRRSSQAMNAAKAGQFVVEPPTLICLGFEWAIAGDENRNATVKVSYRPAGQSAWKDALPLLRMGGEKIFRAPYTVPEGFAGSILDLAPATEYEVRLTMSDPDGVTGQAVQNVKVRTRGEPRAAPGAVCCTSTHRAGAERSWSRASPA